MKTFRFVHFSTFYSIFTLFYQIDINWYRLLFFFFWNMNHSWTSPSPISMDSLGEVDAGDLLVFAAD